MKQLDSWWLTVQGWLTPEFVWVCSTLGVLIALASLALVPFLVARIPMDYFIADYPPRWRTQHGVDRVIAFAAHTLKNMIGCILLLLGVAMLFLPGQGLLTILLSLMLIDFPGKKRLEHVLVKRPGVRKTLAWLRARQGKPPLLFH